MSTTEEPKTTTVADRQHKRRKSNDTEALRNIRGNSTTMMDPNPSTTSSTAAGTETTTKVTSQQSEKVSKETSPVPYTIHRSRRDSELSRSRRMSAGKSFDATTPSRPRRASESSSANGSLTTTTTTNRRRHSSMDELAIVGAVGDPFLDTAMSPVHIGGTAHVGSITINTPRANPPTPSNNQQRTVPLSVPPSIVSTQAESKQDQPPLKKKNGCERCCDCTKNCLENNKLCPSTTGAFEMFTILIDAVGILFLVFANISPWTKSVPPCTDCPIEFSAGAWLVEKQLGLTYGVWNAGTMNNAGFVSVAEYFRFVNTTETLTWAQQYSSYYFPPQSKVLWSDLSSSNVCQANTPGYLMWGFPYSLCPFSLPSALMGTQALLIIGCICAGFSMLFMIGARKGSSAFAVTSTLCSGISFITTIGAVVCFSQWSYTRAHFDTGLGTIPLKAVSSSTNGTSASGSMIVPVAANFIWDMGYYFAIFAIICEIFTTIVSWIVGTERWLWAAEPDIIYGPDAWTVNTDFDRPVGFKPTLQQMAEMESQRHHTVVLA